MKDPLRYLIAEGWMSIFYYPNPNKFGDFSGDYRASGDFCGDYRASKVAANMLGVKNIDGKDHLVVGNVAYNISNDFFLEYGVRCEDEADSKIKRKEWGDEYDAITNNFANIQKELVGA